MRFLILIALVCAVRGDWRHFGNNQFAKTRFYNLLNNYQRGNLYNNWDQQDNLYNLDDNVYGDNLYGDNLYGNNLYTDNLLGDNVYGDNRYGYSYADDFTGDFDTDYTRQDMWQYGRDQRGIWDDDYNTMDIQDDLLNQDTILGQNQWTRRDLNDDEWIGSPLKEVCDANHKLASRLYKQCKDDKDDKNTVVSPLSIQLALNALNKGARGNTKRQIGRVIAGRTPAQERHQILNQLARQVRRQRGNDLNTIGQITRINPVTVIAINTRTPAQQQFIQTVRNQPGCHVQHCNFQNQPQSCRQMINNWISQRTNMKINQIVPRDAITDNTKMVLVNALEMKAQWGRQMRNHVTKSAKFFPLESNKVKVVEVMETQGQFKYYEDQLVKIVGIPTQGHEMTFYTIVPKHKDGLTAVEKLHLQDGEQLKQILRQADRQPRQVGVQLPKFQIKHKMDVRRTLQKQGVTDCFDPIRADFSRITGMSKRLVDEIEDNTMNRFDLQDNFDNEYGRLGGDIAGLGDKKTHLNKFIHQATIKVTENGITCATQLNNQYDTLDNLQRNTLDFNQLNRFGLDGMDNFDDVTSLFGGNMLMGGRQMVKANRGFAFVVKHNPTQQLVLMGRVIDAAQRNVNNAFQTINNVDQL